MIFSKKTHYRLAIYQTDKIAFIAKIAQIKYSQ